jgi:aldehyde dehydrogenase (NAD+)
VAISEIRGRASTDGDGTFQLKSPDRFYIDGEWVEPTTDAMIEVVTPSTEKPFIRVAEAAAQDMDRAVSAARRAFDEGPWPRMSVAERATYLRALAEGIRGRGEAIGFGQTSEMGALYSMSKFAGMGIGQTYEMYADLGERFDFVEKRVPGRGVAAAMRVFEPVGVVGAIVPWNAAGSLSAFKVGPALIAGCTVVLKSSPESPTAMYILAEVAEEIGLPAGVLNCLTADREVSETLVTDPRVDKISFTGSVAAGRRIASLCGERIARYTLELGGKSPGLILDDYDLAKAAQSFATATSIGMAGQTCASLTRVIIGRERHDEFVELVSDAYSKIRVGDPFDDQSQMGPLAMKRQYERVQHYIEMGTEEGAILATGGGRPAHLERGYYIEPAVFANVENSSTIAQEEIFGPVLSVIPAESEEEAIAMANDTIYGLNAVVFTNDADRAYRVARQLRSGTAAQNGAIYDWDIGFGGFKQSGIGREGGVNGLLSFVEPKTVLLMGEPTPL